MSLETILSLLLGIPIGILSGLYTGLIVTRYARFSELRNEALRIIRQIEFMGEDGRVDIDNDEKVADFLLIAGDLFFLGHKKAGENLLLLFSDFKDVKDSARSGRIGVEEFAERHGVWQSRIRDLPGSKRILWSLWGRI